MFNKKYLFLSILFIILISCKNENPVQPTNVAPVLKNFTVPDTIFTQINQSYIVSVHVSDENGLDDIAAVKYEILNSLGNVFTQGDLFDDGDYDLHGDIIANNGTYSQRLNINFPTGVYQIIVSAIDKSELESDPLENSFYAKEGVINNAPTLAVLQIPDSVYVDKIVPFFFQVRAEDEDSDDYISKVTFQVLGPTISDLALEGELVDDGSSGDQTAGDGIYSIETTTEFASWKFGSYHLYMTAFDSKQKASKSLYTIIPWAKMELGVAPVVLNISAPDTLNRPTTGDKSILLTIETTDPDHNNDVKEVFFYSKKPNGEYANSGNPFNLYDDGQLGDATANDNKFSLVIWITSANDLGDYVFEFQARDYSDLLSNNIIHTLTVIE
ncbi:hypothetical protein H8E88_29090 [candidate division KSB1 bacterium]|nr:hypothetical protein [candidate division KSB1 bacterium]MBL7095535.1 hypothetical protein [candidate division KSB1 bacterium]